MAYLPVRAMVSVVVWWTVDTVGWWVVFIALWPGKTGRKVGWKNGYLFKQRSRDTEGGFGLCVKYLRESDTCLVLPRDGRF